ncbi:MAG: NADAR family protein [archaeon]|nr:NADAR family protein [archaeon]
MRRRNELNTRTYDVDWAKNQTGKEYVLFYGYHEKGQGVSKACLSQWYQCSFKVDNVNFTSSLQFLMYQKASYFNDDEGKNKIINETEPKKIKALGKTIKNFQHEAWKTVSEEIAIEGNFYKFYQNEELKSFLLGTGDKILVEANPHDNKWGIALSSDESDKCKDPNQWKGKNLTGFTLMEVRDLIKKGYTEYVPASRKGGDINNAGGDINNSGDINNAGNNALGIVGAPEERNLP